eukprot:7428657-Pyramimonas_sp.AAC.1
MPSATQQPHSSYRRGPAVQKARSQPAICVHHQVDTFLHPGNQIEAGGFGQLSAAFSVTPTAPPLATIIGR